MRNLFIFVFLSIYILPFNLKALDLINLELEDGFEISIFAENLDSPRQMAEGENGTIFVGERGGVTGGNVHDAIEWAKTGRGGQVYDLVKASIDTDVCSSRYNLCE